MAFYTCEWSDCKFTSNDFEIFYYHVREHTACFYNNNDDNDSLLSLVDGQNSCLWRDCYSDSCDNVGELVRHVLFHGYHTRLKHLGLQAQINSDLSQCSLDAQARNLVPEFTDEFCCEWEHCDLTTCCPNSFYRHVEVHIKELETLDPFDCKWKGCTFVSKKRSKLKDHSRTHTGEKCFSCPSCGGLFCNKTKFLDHIRRQNTMESESYQCSHCFKFCASERILRDHMRQHVNHLRCSLCNMTCPNKSALQHHLNFRHSDNRPYPCNICENRFKTSNDLRRHQQTHDPIYNFSCEVDGCNYVAKALQSLRRHYRVHHQNTDGGRYECHICGNRYSRGTGLTKHLKKQHTFGWPDGHTRFRYKEHDDGTYQLQTVRFESVELSQQMVGNGWNALENDMEENDASEEWHDLLQPGQEHQTEDTLEHESQASSTSGTNDGRIESDNGSVSSTPASSLLMASSTPTHEHLLNMLNQFSAEYAGQSGTVDNNTVDRTTDNCDMNKTGSPSREEIAAHAVLDLQEAASFLAQLRDSTMTH